MPLVPIALVLLLSIYAAAQKNAPAIPDSVQEQRTTLLAEKAGLESDIKKINAQIAHADSATKAEQKFWKELQSRQKADIERRKVEIESLDQKLAELSAEMRKEKGSISASQTRIENVNATRKALTAQVAAYCRKLESFIKTGLPWDTEARAERTSALCQDLENGNASTEEGFSRLRAVYAEEIRFGDEVQISNRTITRNNGEAINASILRIGNQWIVYQDDAGLLFGVLNRKLGKDGSYEYSWKEDLSFDERQAVRTAIDVKLSRKPPQMIKLPLSLSINH
jgi:predicted RNase H-like nuclease (RuvC/YqgF family)